MSGEDISAGLQMVGAVVLAAGMSRRMGAPKLVLPWGSHTVIWQVVDRLSAAGVREIVVVTGGAREQVEQALAGTPARFAHNLLFEDGEMLHSLQAGIRALPQACDALLVVLGDQPMIETAAMRMVVERYITSQARLVIPSYQMRRGHPWLVSRSYWDELLDLAGEKTLHDFIQAHQGEIQYVNYDSPSILKDMDTPEDYRQQRP